VQTRASQIQAASGGNYGKEASVSTETFRSQIPAQEISIDQIVTEIRGAGISWNESQVDG